MHQRRRGSTPEQVRGQASSPLGWHSCIGQSPLLRKKFGNRHAQRERALHGVAPARGAWLGPGSASWLLPWRCCRLRRPGRRTRSFLSRTSARSGLPIRRPLGRSTTRCHFLSWPLPTSRSGSETYRTLCVRPCDGYYFPISQATGVMGLSRRRGALHGSLRRRSAPVLSPQSRRGCCGHARLRRPVLCGAIPTRSSTTACSSPAANAGRSLGPRPSWRAIALTVPRKPGRTRGSCGCRFRRGERSRCRADGPHRSRRFSCKDRGRTEPLRWVTTAAGRDTLGCRLPRAGTRPIALPALERDHFRLKHILRF